MEATEVIEVLPAETSSSPRAKMEAVGNTISIIVGVIIIAQTVVVVGTHTSKWYKNRKARHLHIVETEK